MMKNTGIYLPEEMMDEIAKRREKGSSRSEYIREAIQARFDAEDAGDWDAPDLDGPEAPADD